MGGGLPNSGDVFKGVGNVAQSFWDPLNITGTGGKGYLGDAVNNLNGSNAADSALAAQQAGAAQATSSITSAYDQGRKDLQPYQAAGGTALSSLAGNDFMKDYQQDPGYQFRLDEGNKAINSAAAARGMGNSGATMKALTKYGQDYATNDYSNVYNRQYQRLSGLAGMGASAAGQQSNAAGQYGANLANIQTGMANATASSQIAKANGKSQFLGQLVQGGAAYSDRRLKTDIEPVDKAELVEMKKHLKAYSFKYTSEDYGHGDWVGVMAQDLEKSKLGRTLVFEDMDGNKQIHLKKVMSLFLATMAEG